MNLSQESNKIILSESEKKLWLAYMTGDKKEFFEIIYERAGKSYVHKLYDIASDRMYGDTSHTGVFRGHAAEFVGKGLVKIDNRTITLTDLGQAVYILVKK